LGIAATWVSIWSFDFPAKSLKISSEAAVAPHAVAALDLAAGAMMSVMAQLLPQSEAKDVAQVGAKARTSSKNALSPA
jgi:hypothetical protein